jgi:hypothetical protein
VHCFLLGGVALGELDFGCCLGGVSAAVTRIESLKRDFSFFVILLLFLAVCIVAEAGCIGIVLILIYALY